MTFMIVAPSILFYIESLGGNHDWYGFILSLYSFAAFCAKPMLGHWTDVSGFRVPYLVSIGMAVMGGFLYLFASLFTKGRMAMMALLMSRVLAGIGGGSSALGFAYIVRILPLNERTAATTLLSTTRTIVMAVVPSLNVLLAKVHVDFWGDWFVLDPLNVVGLVIAVGNMGLMLAVHWSMEEPGPPSVGSVHSSDYQHVTNHEDEEEDDVSTSSLIMEDKHEHEYESELHPHPPSAKNNNNNKHNLNLLNILRAILSDPQVWVPFLTIYVLNACFQLIETALAPSSHHALNWGPIQISIVLSIMCLFIFLSMLTVLALSLKGTPDSHLMRFGLIVQGIGYGMMYFLWTFHSGPFHFVLPAVVAVSSFALLGAPNRSLFSAAVEGHPVLTEHAGTMQALLGMGASVAGFTAPGFTASFVLQDSEIVEYSRHGRELTKYALLAPLLSMVCLVAVVWAGPPKGLEEGGGMARMDHDHEGETENLVVDEEPEHTGHRHHHTGNNYEGAPEETTTLLTQRNGDEEWNLA